MCSWAQAPSLSTDGKVLTVPKSEGLLNAGGPKEIKTWILGQINLSAFPATMTTLKFDDSYTNEDFVTEPKIAEKVINAVTDGEGAGNYTTICLDLSDCSNLVSKVKYIGEGKTDWASPKSNFQYVYSGETTNQDVTKGTLYFENGKLYDGTHGDVAGMLTDTQNGKKYYSFWYDGDDEYDASAHGDVAVTDLPTETDETSHYYGRHYYTIPYDLASDTPYDGSHGAYSSLEPDQESGNKYYTVWYDGENPYDASAHGAAENLLTEEDQTSAHFGEHYYSVYYDGENPYTGTYQTDTNGAYYEAMFDGENIYTGNYIIDNVDGNEVYYYEEWEMTKNGVVVTNPDSNEEGWLKAAEQGNLQNAGGVTNYSYSNGVYSFKSWSDWGDLYTIQKVKRYLTKGKVYLTEQRNYVENRKFYVENRKFYIKEKRNYLDAEEDWYYVDNGKTYIVDESCVTVPDSSQPNVGVAAISVGGGTAFAFSNGVGKRLSSIAFPESDNFTAIPDNLCDTEKCPNLTSISFGDNSRVEWIGLDAFRGYKDANKGLSKLTNVTFPTSLKVINGDAFYGCVKFTKVDLGNLENLVKIDFAAFNMYDDGKDNQNNNINSLTSVILPGTASKPNRSLRFFGNQVFSSAHITSLNFRYCEGIKHFAYDKTNTFGEGNGEAVGAEASSTFYWHQDLEELILPPNLEYVAGEDGFGAGNNIIAHCPKLELVQFTGRGVYDSDCELTNKLIIGVNAFALSSDADKAVTVKSTDMRKLNRVILSDNVYQIRKNAFAYCALDSVHIPASVALIEQDAFDWCAALKTVVFDDVKSPNTCSAATYIEGGSGNGAFYNCEQIEDVYVNNTHKELTCENYGFNFAVTWGHANPAAQFATLHYPKDFTDNYVNLAHPLTDQIAANPAKFHNWLHKHVMLAGVPNQNGWWEFINSGPMNTKIEDEPVCQDIILRTFSDWNYSYLVPDGLRAYVVSDLHMNGQNYEVTLTRILAIPKQTGVILYGHPNGKNLDGEPILSLTPVEFAKKDDLLDDGTRATYDHGMPLCRANWNHESNYVKNYLEPTSTPTTSDLNKIKDATERAAVAALIEAHSKDWKNGGKYIKPFENINNDDPIVVNAGSGNEDVAFRNFGMGRYNSTESSFRKQPLGADDDNYMAFFRLIPAWYPTGKAYMRLSAYADASLGLVKEYDEPTGAEILVKPDEDNELPYYFEFKKSNNLQTTYSESASNFVNFRDADHLNPGNLATLNPKHWWYQPDGFDWYIVEETSDNEYGAPRKNWGRRPSLFTANPQLAPIYLGELGEDADGIVKLVIPAENTNVNGDYYTLQGVKVNNPTKGVYIRNGKKIIIK